MECEIEKCVATTHPSLPGHFPGNPVVPGVVILNEIMDAVSAWRSDLEIQGINSVKFMSPLLPDEIFSIQLQMLLEDQLKFQCFVAGRKLAIGQFMVKSR